MRLVLLAASAVVGLSLQQIPIPQPFPRPGASQPAPSPPATPPAAKAPTPGPPPPPAAAVPKPGPAQPDAQPTEATLGVPIYPGAKRDDDSRKLASFRFDFGDVHKAFAVSAATYRTSDSIDRVTDFYRGELPHWLISQKEDGGLQLSFTRHGYKRFVAICEEDGETRIALASVGEPASN